MRNNILLALLFLTAIACSSNDTADNTTEQNGNQLSNSQTPESTNSNDYLIRVQDEEDYELGIPCGYINEKGDTIIPIGKYSLCWTDTIQTFGIVYENASSSFIGIDKQGNKLYGVYMYDNGPDYLSDGLFRIIKNDKVGFANEQGEIKIAPQFACAFPFENGKAKVTLTCDLVQDGEYQQMTSEDWFFINTEGEKITE